VITTGVTGVAEADGVVVGAADDVVAADALVRGTLWAEAGAGEA
jgi:hypothetical protein